MPGNKPKMSADRGRKRFKTTLTIVQKVELLKKVDEGQSSHELCRMYNIGRSTLQDIKKQKNKILAFYAERDSDKGLGNRRHMCNSKSAKVDRAVYQWFKKCRSEGVLLTGPQVCEKAKKFHKDLQISRPCLYSEGWLRNFKNRHGICSMKGSDENLSAKTYVEQFASLVEKEQLTPEQVYNVDETALFWRCVPRRTLSETDEKRVEEEKVTVLTCANAAGTHKCRLLLIGNDSCPLTVKEATVLPLIYETDENSLVTRTLFTEWFKNHFVVESREHCRKAGLSENCKIILLLDNCSAHPDATRLVSGNVSAKSFPRKCASVIQPMEQGIVRSVKIHYRKEFLSSLLTTLDRSVPDNGINLFRDKYTLEDCVSAVARSWDSVDESTLRNSWLRLWPLPTNDRSKGLRPSAESADAAELLLYARAIGNETTNDFTEESIIEWMNCDDDTPVGSTITDAEVVAMMHRPTKTQDRLEMVAGIKIADQFINFLKQKSFITQQEISNVNGIREKLITEKRKLGKRMTREESSETTREESFEKTSRRRSTRRCVRRRQSLPETDGSLSYDDPPSCLESAPTRDKFSELPRSLPVTSPSAMPDGASVSIRTGTRSKTSSNCRRPFHVVHPDKTKHDGSRELCPICPPLVSVLRLEDDTCFFHVTSSSSSSD